MVGLHLLHIRVLSSLLTSPAAAARFRSCHRSIHDCGNTSELGRP